MFVDKFFEVYFANDKNLKTFLFIWREAKLNPTVSFV